MYRTYYYILLLIVAIIAINLYYTTSSGLKIDLDNDDEFIEERAMPPLLGSNKCTWGPSYFCDNANNAKECGLNYEEDCAKYKTPTAAP